MANKCKITVTAGEHNRSNCPVSVDMPLGYAECRSVVLRDEKTGNSVPCQITKKGKDAVLTFLVKGLKAETSKTLVATACKENDETKPVVAVRDHVNDGKVDVVISGKLFTSYHYSRQWVRPFLYPVIGPYNAQVTRNWPIVGNVPGEHRDHAHHKSIWVAYGECNTCSGGSRLSVDNWSEDKGHGWQRHRAFRDIASGPVFGQIIAKNDWCASNEKRQFEEIRKMRFYALPGGERLFDMDVTFRMMDGQVTFRDTKEGGLVSVRVASSMDVRNGGKIENGYGGVNEKETWGKKAPWCDYSGIVNGKQVGIAIIEHEDNPRYPTQWHVRDYGLMTANCFAWKYYRPEAGIKGDLVFKKGAVTTWRYRLCIHRGDATAGKIKERFADYIAPPNLMLE